MNKAIILALLLVYGTLALKMHVQEEIPEPE